MTSYLSTTQRTEQASCMLLRGSDTAFSTCSSQTQGSPEVGHGQCIQSSAQHAGFQLRCQSDVGIGQP